MPIRTFLIPLAILVLFSGCVTNEETTIKGGDDPWVGELVAYKKVVSERHGIVGYMKVFEYRQEEHGEPYQIYRVLDLGFVERGILYPRGTGVKFLVVAPEIAAVTGVTREEIQLGAQPLELNLAKILDVDPPLKTMKATEADLKH
jgi:hypothetical protein